MDTTAFILTNLPAMLAAIKAVELAFGPKSGEKKKAVLMTAVTAGSLVPNAHVVAYAAAVDAIVAAVFPKKAEPKFEAAK